VPTYLMTNPGSSVYSANNRRVQVLAGYIEGETAGLTEDSRVKLIWRYMNLISERPLLGYGTSFIKKQETGPHNTFLTLWVENGVLGLAVYMTLLLVAFWYFRNLGDTCGQVLCAAIFVLSLFNHNLLFMRPVIIALGLLSALAARQLAIKADHKHRFRAALGRTGREWSMRSKRQCCED
jgi:hypothetical protein